MSERFDELVNHSQRSRPVAARLAVLRRFHSRALIAMDTSKGRAQSAREPRYQDWPTAADSAVGTTSTVTPVQEKQ